METNSKNKKVLVTAGPTWIPIDRVRVITNVFKGTLGHTIAKGLAQKGYNTTLLLGPGLDTPKEKIKNLEIIRYKFYQELFELVNDKLKTKKYFTMVHSAAVADYTPISIKDGKIKSGKKQLTIKLKPTIKIVDLVKKIDPNIFLVKFKLEVGLKKDDLMRVAKKSMLQSNADLIVANEFSQTQGGHLAYIIDRTGKIIKAKGKENISDILIKKIESERI